MYVFISHLLQFLHSLSVWKWLLGVQWYESATSVTCRLFGKARAVLTLHYFLV